MKRLTRSYAYAVLSAFLLIFLAYSCDMSDDTPVGDESGQVLRITADDPMEEGPDGVILVTKELPNSGGLEMVLSYPDLQTYQVTVAKNGISYNLDNFTFVADLSKKESLLGQSIQQIPFDDLVAGISNGDISHPMGIDGLFSQGFPTDQELDFPSIELKSTAYAALQNSVVVPDTVIWIHSNCGGQPQNNCSGPCAVVRITDDKTEVGTGDCTFETVCYCKVTKITEVPRADPVVVPGDK